MNTETVLLSEHEGQESLADQEYLEPVAEDTMSQQQKQNEEKQSLLDSNQQQKRRDDFSVVEEVRDEDLYQYKNSAC